MSSELTRALKQTLETERMFGLTELPVGASRQTAGLDELKQRFNDCRLCGLCETRTTLVFGQGDPKAQLMFVGEAPGYDEDRQGLAFVGKAGGLLTKIIEAMGFKREDVYIANCLKCRPPENRPPQPDEIATCKPILLAQIDAIRPKVICALGKFAAQTLLSTEEPIGRLRGKFHALGAIAVMPTFHPAYLLRNPGDKKLVWQDMQKVMALLGQK